ncbi:MAG: hypothetical protein K9M49_00825 [Candidatus Marinimicrobia bacterium]|nr:hypothetical protein [Candidatus Neomarinimicrobiota bacterium]MCF7850594.1 hypothetical protein [Candidatus Neomarinimicrobiota bacterium]MCF7903672.1 hypothetical protein [Candidatus Neomarinimicrobiota bacterium]
MGTIGMVFGLAGLAFAFIANSRLNKLEDKLKELDILDKEFGNKERII